MIGGMPFDEFFSSKNKKHYLSTVDEGERLALRAKVLGMSFEERQKYWEELRSKKGLTPLEHLVRRQLDFEGFHRRRAKVHGINQRNIKRAVEELKVGKREMVITLGGFASPSGESNARGTQKRARGSK